MKDLLNSAKYLAEDLASMILFVMVLEFTHNVPLAIGLGMALGVLQIGYRMVRKLPIDAMQWMSVILVVGSGTATFLTNDPLFVMAKPTIIDFALGLFMLKRGWMTRYLPIIAQETVGDIGVIFGYVWAGLMFLTGVLNIVLALTVDALTWGLFRSFFSIATIVTLFLIQFSTMRFIARRRVARRELGNPAVA
jgi:intracellular septation protein